MSREVSEKRARQGPPLCFICKPVPQIKTVLAGTSGASVTQLVHVFMAGLLPIYCLINDRTVGSSTSKSAHSFYSHFK